MSATPGPADEPPADSGPLDRPEALEGLLLGVSARIRAAVARATGVSRAAKGGAAPGLTEVVGVGAGDHTFGIDVVAERAVDGWLAEVAAHSPLSVLTEDSGWRHVGPQGPLAGFDHGGPRLVLDPIDGTRHLMHDLRAAWVIGAAAPPGPGEPRLSEVSVGVAAELVCRGAAEARELAAIRGRGARRRVLPAGASGEAEATDWQPLRVPDGEGRLDSGYFPFFGFEPRCRAAVQELCARVFERLERERGIDPESVLDDQYISSGGQLTLLALGPYRAIVDARHSLGRTLKAPARTAKPYDVAGAILVAEEAGAVVRALDGSALDFPLDTSTPVEFAGYVNRATADALAPIVRAELSALVASG